MALNADGSGSSIWDDSALVDTWNDALQEYQKYHSIKARGENPDSLLKLSDHRSNGIIEDMDYEEGELAEDLVSDPHAEKELAEETTQAATPSDARPPTVQEKFTSPGNAQNRAPALPQHLIGQIQDEGLKTLLMSWYYAGYYTGLWEGQQQGRQG